MFPLETWYEKPNKLATRWANIQPIYDGTYGYFYAEGSPLAYRYPAAGLPAGWQQWSSQMALGGVPSASYTPEIMQWLTQSASAYQAGNDIHVTFTLTGEQLMRIMSAMAMGVPGMAGEGGADIMQALSQILGTMQMNWDVVLDASTYMVRYLQGQVVINRALPLRVAPAPVSIRLKARRLPPCPPPLGHLGMGGGPRPYQRRSPRRGDRS